MDKFEGEVGKFKAWWFDLKVTLNLIDSGLSRELEELVKRHGQGQGLKGKRVENWEVGEARG